MRLNALELQQIRNIELAKFRFGAQRHFIKGPNAAGKSSVLEAIGLVSALKSFRSSSLSALIQHGCESAQIIYHFEHERSGPTQLEVRLLSKGRQVFLDGEAVEHWKDFLGKFPAVTFCSEDVQWARGGPEGRRKFLDMSLASTSGEYLQALLSYQKARNARNALLKRAHLDANACRAFELVMSEHAELLHACRVKATESLRGFFRELHGKFDGLGQVDWVYRPSLPCTRSDAFAEHFEKTRSKDFEFGSTRQGPHRDACSLCLNTHNLKDFASDGQQRSAVMALRLAQAFYLREKTNTTPLLLVDDVLGELSETNKAAFWSCVGEDFQILATGTQIPEATALPWQVHSMLKGELQPEP